MKKSDAQSIISVIGRAVRKLVDPIKLQLVAVTERQQAAQQLLDEQRSLLDDVRLSLTEARAVNEQLRKDLDTMRQNAAAVPGTDTIVAAVLKALPLGDIAALVKAPAIDMDGIASRVKPLEPPTAEQIADIVLSSLSLDEIAARVKLPVIDVPAVPTAKEIAAEITVPVVPTVDEVAKLCMQEFPIESVVKMIRDAMPSMPTAEDVLKLIPLAEMRADLSTEMIRSIPVAEAIAKLVPIPEIPAVPTLDEIVSAVKEVLPSLIPEPVKGDPGDSVTIDDVRPLIEELIKAMPKAATTEDVAEMVKLGIGYHLTPAVEGMEQKAEASFSKWALEFERRANDHVAKFLESIPKPRDGHDGLGIQDFRVEVNQEQKQFTFAWSRDGVAEKSASFFVPWMRHVGVWKQNAKYLEGDCVVRSGCSWIAKKNDPAGEPSDGKSGDWALIVKRGNDGRDFKGDRPDPKPVKLGK